jgi:hypothetical protein
MYSLSASWSRTALSCVAALLAFLPTLLSGQDQAQPQAESSNTSAPAQSTPTHDVRIVWVLFNSQIMSEAGPVPGPPEIALYEMECVGAALGVVNRVYDDVHLKYGTRTFSVQLNRSPLSVEGGKALSAAFKNVCLMPPADSRGRRNDP